MSARSSIPLAMIAAVTVISALAQTVWAEGDIKGHAARIEKIKDKPHMGYVEVAEANLFIAAGTDSVIGLSRRLGTRCDYGSGCFEYANTYDGCYCTGWPPDNDSPPGGLYSILVNEPLFFIRPTLVPNVTIIDGQTVTLDIDIPIDYSTYFKDTGQWTSYDSPWYQTFTATGISVTGVSFVLAGTNATSAEVSILEDNGDPNVTNWQVIGSRTEESIGSGGDNWVRFRSGQIPMTPGTQYAVRITGLSGGDLKFAPYKRNKDSNSYGAGDPDIEGQAYNSAGQAQNFDLNYIVFADNDGTVVTMNKRRPGMGELRSPNYWGLKWGQTFIAQGQGLAAVDVKAACVNDRWDTKFRWRIFEANPSGPTGPQIGPTKITRAAWNAGGFQQGASYNPDQVPLTPGQTYFIEFEAYQPYPDSNGFNPYLMDNDSYDGGHGYWWSGTAWDPRPNDDVNMTIMEYAYAGPLIELNKDSINRSVYLGDFLSSDSFTVTNVGGETLNYNIVDDGGWLWESPINGSLLADQADLIMVNYGVGTLPVNTYNATITVSGNAINGPQQIAVTVNVYTVGPDLDGDADVDQEDFGLFQACLSGSGIAPTESCAEADFENDNDVDQDDFGIFEGCMSGGEVPAARDCAD